MVRAFISAGVAAGLMMSSVAYADTRSAAMLPAVQQAKAVGAERASAPALAPSKLQEEGASGWILALLAAAAFIGGIVLLADGDDEGDTVG